MQTVSSGQTAQISSGQTDIGDLVLTGGTEMVEPASNNSGAQIEPMTGNLP